MGRTVCVALVAVLVGVALALAGPVAGDKKAAYGIGTARQPMSSTTKLEDNAAPEPPVDVGVHRRILSSNLGPSVFNRNKPACLGSCSEPGRPYTGRGCTRAYGCGQ